MLKLIAYKCGMTRFFTDDGKSIPVTVIKLYDNYIIEKKNINEKYSLIKISAKERKKNFKKPIIGIYKNLNLKIQQYIKSSIIENDKIKDFKIGEKIPLTLINNYKKVDVLGASKGKGFAGTIKKHNFKSQKASHGNSLSHRVPGSIGQCQSPGKVFKGKKMAGRLGNTNVTIKNLTIINIYNDLNTILLKGSVPGNNGKKLIINLN